jgi:hypothetical protein
MPTPVRDKGSSIGDTGIISMSWYYKTVQCPLRIQKISFGIIFGSICDSRLSVGDTETV